MSELGDKALEWETLLIDAGKTVIDGILTNCHFCSDRKVISTIVKNAEGLEILEDKPCPNCKDKK